MWQFASTPQGMDDENCPSNLLRALPRTDPRHASRGAVEPLILGGVDIPQVCAVRH